MANRRSIAWGDLTDERLAELLYTRRTIMVHGCAKRAHWAA